MFNSRTKKAEYYLIMKFDISFENLIEKCGAVSIHTRNWHVLAKEMFKISRGILSSNMKNLLELKSEHCNLRFISQTIAPSVTTRFYDTNSI